MRSGSNAKVPGRGRWGERKCFDDVDLGDAQIPPPDRSESLYDVIQSTGPADGTPALLLEAARLTLECEAALLRGVPS